MKTADFVVAKRPSLAAIERFPKVDFADYERRLAELQETLQRIQQAYLGTALSEQRLGAARADPSGD